MFLGAFAFSGTSAHAQVTFLDLLDATEEFTVQMVNGLQTSRSITPSQDITVDEVVLQLTSTFSGSLTTALSNTTISIGTAEFSYSSYNSGTRRATFTGTANLSSSTAYLVIIECDCGSATYDIPYTDNVTNSYGSFGSSNAMYKKNFRGH